MITKPMLDAVVGVFNAHPELTRSLSHVNRDEHAIAFGFQEGLNAIVVHLIGLHGADVVLVGEPSRDVRRRLAVLCEHIGRAWGCARGGGLRASQTFIAAPAIGTALQPQTVARLLAHCTAVDAWCCIDEVARHAYRLEQVLPKTKTLTRAETTITERTLNLPLKIMV